MTGRLTPLRAVVLTLVVALLAVTLAVPLRTYWSQRNEARALVTSNAELDRQIGEYQQKVNELDDPEYIKAQARARLMYAYPGDKVLVIDKAAPPVKSPEELAREKNESQPWYQTLWDSVSQPQ